MSLVGFKGQNHPQQTKKRGAKPEVDNLETPWEFFEPLNERFGFTLDAAALPHNAKCQRYYTDRDAYRIWNDPAIPGQPKEILTVPKGFDGLTNSWAGERVWCNPPYSNIESWVEKAWFERSAPPHDRAELVVMLLPANRAEQGWWQRQVEPYRDRPDGVLRVEFLPGRLRFIKHGHDRVEPNQRPPFGCCLLIWGESSTRVDSHTEGAGQ